MTLLAKTPVAIRAAMAAAALLAANAAAAADPSWDMACTSVDRASPATCHMTQRIATEQGALVLVFELVTVPGTEGTRLSVLTPLGVTVSEGVSLAVDDKPVASFGIKACDQRGCLTNDLVGKDVIDKLKAGAKMSITFTVAASGNKQTVTVPLTGFTATYARIAL